jgi:hypothetical protein
LDVTDGSTTNGVKVQVWDCTNPDKNQQWSVTADHRIAWANEHECLDLTDGKTTNGNLVCKPPDNYCRHTKLLTFQQIQVWHCTANDNNQVWNIV